MNYCQNQLLQFNEFKQLMIAGKRKEAVRTWISANFPQMMALGIKLFVRVTVNWRSEPSKSNKQFYC